MKKNRIEVIEAKRREMKTIAERLQNGDQLDISNTTGYTLQYVNLVMNGKRPPNKEIRKIALEIISDREKRQRKAVA